MSGVKSKDAWEKGDGYEHDYKARSEALNKSVSMGRLTIGQVAALTEPSLREPKKWGLTWARILAMPWLQRP